MLIIRAGDQTMIRSKPSSPTVMTKTTSSADEYSWTVNQPNNSAAMTINADQEEIHDEWEETFPAKIRHKLWRRGLASLSGAATSLSAWYLAPLGIALSNPQMIDPTTIKLDPIGIMSLATAIMSASGAIELRKKPKERIERLKQCRTDVAGRAMLLLGRKSEALLRHLREEGQCSVSSGGFETVVAPGCSNERYASIDVRIVRTGTILRVLSLYVGSDGLPNIFWIKDSYLSEADKAIAARIAEEAISSVANGKYDPSPVRAAFDEKSNGDGKAERSTPIANAGTTPTPRLIPSNPAAGACMIELAAFASFSSEGEAVARGRPKTAAALRRIRTACDSMAASLADARLGTHDIHSLVDHLLPRSRSSIRKWIALSTDGPSGQAVRAAMDETENEISALAELFETRADAMRSDALAELAEAIRIDSMVSAIADPRRGGIRT